MSTLDVFFMCDIMMCLCCAVNTLRQARIWQVELAIEVTMSEVAIRFYHALTQMTGVCCRGRIGVRVLAFILIPVVLSGCEMVRYHRGYVLPHMGLEGIKVDVDTKESIEEKLGFPTLVSVFDSDSWYYVSQTEVRSTFSRQKIDQQRVLELRFNIDGYVIGIKKYDKTDGLPIQISEKKTVSYAHDYSLVKDLFGNLGKFRK
jgi:outer membrane protein assembly factor BamE (lipoprotein component of BamABCDE complex)